MCTAAVQTDCLCLDLLGLFCVNTLWSLYQCQKEKAGQAKIIIQWVNVIGFAPRYKLETWVYLNITLLYVIMENTSIDQHWLNQIKKLIQLDGILKGSKFARKQHHGPSCLLSDYQAELSQPFVLYHTTISYTMCLPGTGRCETQPVSWVLHWPL